MGDLWKSVRCLALRYEKLLFFISRNEIYLIFINVLNIITVRDQFKRKCQYDSQTHTHLHPKACLLIKIIDKEQYRRPHQLISSRQTRQVMDRCKYFRVFFITVVLCKQRWTYISPHLTSSLFLPRYSSLYFITLSLQFFFIKCKVLLRQQLQTNIDRHRY